MPRRAFSKAIPLEPSPRLLFQLVWIILAILLTSTFSNYCACTSNNENYQKSPYLQENDETCKEPVEREQHTCELPDAASHLGIPASAVAKMTSREVDKTVLSVEQDEGVGARVRRSIGRPEVRMQI